ncbi:uncharacterized protein C8R40DRAFT_1088128 [Lentinula edodes]|uniref:uncharacterized protein n=1 Tax=Lentinula edodes TaxID=5353 RepID=UPI001E8CEC18|nr:uncharacterized protein C8R40DRAFT_1088128 [Lentinula edodes]KAH7878955.1 hypothetical protein C8R40DRAFT_1088128 [Lentinula edodes]
MPHPNLILYVALATFALFGSLFLVCHFAPVVNRWKYQKQVKQDLDVEKSNFEYSRKLFQEGNLNSEESLPSGSLAKMISGLSFECGAPFVPLINAVTSSSMPLPSSLLYSLHRKVVPLPVKQHHLSIPAFCEDFVHPSSPLLNCISSTWSLNDTCSQTVSQSHPNFHQSQSSGSQISYRKCPSPYIHRNSQRYFTKVNRAAICIPTPARQMNVDVFQAIHAKKFAMREISGLGYYGGYKTGVQRSAYMRAYFGTISSMERPH